MNVKKLLFIFTCIVSSTYLIDCSDAYTLDTHFSAQVKDVYQIPTLHYLCKKTIQDDFFMKVEQAFVIAQKINPTDNDITNLDNIFHHNDELQTNSYVTNNITLPSLLHLRQKNHNYTLVDHCLKTDNSQGLQVALNHGLDMYALTRSLKCYCTEHDTTLVQSCFGFNRISINCLRVLLTHEQKTTAYDVHNKESHSKSKLVNTGNKDTTPLLSMFNNKFHYEANVKAQEAVSLLLAAGANVNIVNKYGKYLIESAIDNRMEEVAKLLIIHGADIHRQIYKDHKTLLSLVVIKKLNNIIEPLIHTGANINQFDHKKCTALHYACKHNNQEAALILFKHRADIHLYDNNGDTALHHAVKDNNHNIVQWLLSIGSDIHQANNDGKTPLVFAKQRKAKKVIPLLIAAQKQSTSHHNDIAANSIDDGRNFKKQKKIRKQSDFIIFFNKVTL